MEKGGLSRDVIKIFDRGLIDSFGQLYIGKKPAGYRNILLFLIFDSSCIPSLYGIETMEHNFNSRVNLALETFLCKFSAFPSIIEDSINKFI